jgi:hypothetical protein
MSVAFTREESAETAAAVELPDRPVSPHPNLVTQSGLKALDAAMAAARAAYHATHEIEDLNERRSAVAAGRRGTCGISRSVSGPPSGCRIRPTATQSRSVPR